MTLRSYIDGVLLNNRIRLTGGSSGGIAGLPSIAWFGEPGTAGVEVEDPLGDLDLRGWHTFWVEEDEYLGNNRLFTGWLTGLKISRGAERQGRFRTWTCDITDLNALFSFEVLRSSAASVRPDETDVARAQAMITSHAMAGTPIHDLGRFKTTPIANLTGANFVAQFPAEVLSQGAGVSGKNFYAYWDANTLQIGFHYDRLVQGPAAGISISNVLSDVNNNTVFFPQLDGELERDPTLVITGLLYHYLGGYIYGRNDDTIDALSPTALSPVNFLRDDVYSTDRVGKLTTAQSQLAATLENRSIERDTINVTVRLPYSRVGRVHAGDLINVRFQHLPGYETTPVQMTVTRMVIVPFMKGFYDVHLELANYGIAAPPQGGDPGGGGTPWHGVCDETSLHLNQTYHGPITGVGGTNGTITLSRMPETGSTQVLGIYWDTPGTYANGPTPTGWTRVGTLGVDSPIVIAPSNQNFRLSTFYHVAQPGDTATIAFTNWATAHRLECIYMEYGAQGNVVFDGYDVNALEVNNPAPFVAGPFTPPADKTVLLVSIFVPSNNVNDGWVGAPTGDDVEDVEWGPHDSRMFVWGGHAVRQIGNPATSQTMEVVPTHGGITRGYGAILLSFTCVGEPIIGHTGQVIISEFQWTGNGIRDAGQTKQPYQPGTLRVYVDNVQLAKTSYFETNPAAGDFVLTFAPRGPVGDTRAEIVTVGYSVGTG